ncbi:MAG: hypothetical protein EA408_07620 [Marinilabiliales bacterium]|nr:MAG: hypothetical protein EA408_07620 [Marinilabiliales bacterium]
MFAENELKTLFVKLHRSENLSEKLLINDSILEILDQTLNNPASFFYPFDSLNSVGIISSADSLIRIYTWSISESRSEHRYFGFIQVVEADRNGATVIPLNQVAGNRKIEDRVEYSSDSWYGALYYQVHPVKAGGRVHYTLIGFGFHDVFTNAKMIDVLHIHDNKAVFGAPVFMYKGDTKYRLIFRYSSQVVMFMRYIPELDMIVYDHLSPSAPRFEGQHRFYGPDMTHDALIFQDGKWMHKPDFEWKKPGVP